MMEDADSTAEPGASGSVRKERGAIAAQVLKPCREGEPSTCPVLWILLCPQLTDAFRLAKCAEGRSNVVTNKDPNVVLA